MHTIPEAGMAGPSCVNTRDWSFVVVRDRELLNKMADANGRPAAPLRTCKVGILVCGDLERAFSRTPEYRVIDGAIAAQNMILAANDLGIGSVWLGTWPQMSRVQAQAELFGLPQTQVPHFIIAFGYPQALHAKEKQLRKDSRAHYKKWQVSQPPKRYDGYIRGKRLKTIVFYKSMGSEKCSKSADVN